MDLPLPTAQSALRRPTLAEFVYADMPLSFEERQTISQPHIVAVITEALELDRARTRCGLTLDAARA
jgi:protein-L-isoaspartate O-methyltransferase